MQWNGVFTYAEGTTPRSNILGWLNAEAPVDFCGTALQSYCGMCYEV